MQRDNIDIEKYIKEYKITNYTIIDDYPYIDISSTIIRNKLDNKYLDKEVIDYIRSRGLYENK